MKKLALTIFFGSGAIASFAANLPLLGLLMLLVLWSLWKGGKAFA